MGPKEREDGPPLTVVSSLRGGKTAVRSKTEGDRIMGRVVSTGREGGRITTATNTHPFCRVADYPVWLRRLQCPPTLRRYGHPVSWLVCSPQHFEVRAVPARVQSVASLHVNRESHADVSPPRHRAPPSGPVQLRQQPDLALQLAQRRIICGAQWESGRKKAS